MAKDKRVEILFDERDYRQLAEAARSRRQSVGSVVREAVAKYVVQPTQEERQRAWEHFSSLQGQGGPVGTPEEIKEFITDSQFLDMLKKLDYPEDTDLIKSLEEKLEKNPLSRRETD
ncbi:MAG: hypothetical protein Q7T33_10255 [Dehalococcoidia bacterium]|nr:hypothetical protein [Dehalococcoidia bacterium]